MSLGDIEAGPERAQTAIGKYYSDSLAESEGDYAELILGTSNPEDALLLMMGRLEDLDLNHGQREAAGSVICEVSGILASIDDLEKRAKIRESIWEPVFDAIRIRENPLHGWHVMRNAVHLFDTAGEKLILR